MTRLPGAETGIALLAVLFLLFLAGTAIYLGNVSATSVQLQRQQVTLKALAEAKEALIGYAVSRKDPERPGDFPCPDNPSDGNYDGTQDSPCGNTNPVPRLGRLPWRTAQIGASIVEGLNVDIVDGYGERLWYAVSRNLVDPAGVAELNPDLLNSAPRPWLTVRDANGMVISNRVAAVIISPGPALNQDRSGATPAANQYLESVTVGAVTYNNADSNDCLDGTTCPSVASRTGEDFIAGNPSDSFNDKLVFITIDELMPQLEKRALGEVAQRLRTYYISSDPSPTNRYYPYAANLGTTDCHDGLTSGSLPLTNAGASPCTHPNPSLTGLPAWFTANGWEEFIYYAIADSCTFANKGCDLSPPLPQPYLQVGGTTGIHALVISAGRPIGSQVRPSPLVQNYLDSVENVNGDNIYEAANKPITSTYNDQVKVVAP